MKNQKILLLTLSFIFVGFFCSCSMKKDLPHPIAYYTLDYEQPDIEPLPKLPITLSIEKFKTAAPYDSNRIVYSKNQYSQNNYFYHQWIASPAEMISNLLARDLTASNRFQAVVHSNDPLTSHLLRGTIDEFYEQDTDDQWNAVLSITIILINKNERDKIGQFVFQKNYKKVHPMDQKNPKGLTRALSLAMSEISRLIIADIYNVLQPLP
jgi:cholesterol transport system auxiliary component